MRDRTVTLTVLAPRSALSTSSAAPAPDMTRAPLTLTV